MGFRDRNDIENQQGRQMTYPDMEVLVEGINPVAFNSHEVEELTEAGEPLMHEAELLIEVTGEEEIDAAFIVNSMKVSRETFAVMVELANLKQQQRIANALEKLAEEFRADRKGNVADSIADISTSILAAAGNKD